MSIEEAKLMEFRPKGDELFMPDKVQQQIDFIKQVMKENMIKDHHYGIIPGTKKPTLLKPGAEMLCLVFRLSPRYEITKTELPNGHREYEVICELSSITSGKLQGEGVGMASTMETKHRYRWANKVCPHCSADKIFASKQEYGGGWYCNKHKGGCGAKFKEEDPQITSQATGRRENADVADQFNTILKMAKKRAHTDAVYTVTACSDIFQQEEDNPPDDGGPEDNEPEDGDKGKKYRTKAEAEAAKKKAAKGKAKKDEKPKYLSKEDCEALVAYARSYDWTEEEFQSLISDNGCATVNEVTYDKLKPMMARIDGGGPPEE